MYRYNVAGAARFAIVVNYVRENFDLIIQIVP